MNRSGCWAVKANELSTSRADELLAGVIALNRPVRLEPVSTTTDIKEAQWPGRGYL